MNSPKWSKPLYLVDQSVMSHYWNEKRQNIKETVNSLAEKGIICSSSVTMDEARFSARNPESLKLITDMYSDHFMMLQSPPGMDQIVKDIRTAMWDIGAGRGAQTTDISIASVALYYGATVVHNDKDFITIRRAIPSFSEMRIEIT